MVKSEGSSPELHTAKYKLRRRLKGGQGSVVHHCKGVFGDISLRQSLLGLTALEEPWRPLRPLFQYTS